MYSNSSWLWKIPINVPFLSCFSHNAYLFPAFLQIISARQSRNFSKGRSSYGPLAYLSDIFISGKNVVISQQKWQHFCHKWKYRKNMQADNKTWTYFTYLHIHCATPKLTKNSDLTLWNISFHFNLGRSQKITDNLSFWPLGSAKIIFNL